MTEFERISKDWAFIDSSLIGSEGFADGEYLTQHPRESDEKYEVRKEIATYENIIYSRVTKYAGYLFKVPPLRETNNILLKEIVEDLSGTRENADVFMSNFSKDAKAKGAGLVVVDTMQTTGSLEDQITGRELPYVTAVKPEMVIDYRITKKGAFEYVAYKDVVDNTAFNSGDVPDRIIRYYDEYIWQVYQDTGVGVGSLIEEGEHGLGVCPVLMFSEKGVFLSTGEFSQIASLSKEHYNLKSERRDLLRSQTFSVLAISADQGSRPEVTIGTDNALIYTGSNSPSFISPDAAQVAAYETNISNTLKIMDDTTYTVTTTTAQESGIALELKMQGLNASLSGFAKSLELFERNIWEIICLYLGLPEDSVIVSYVTEFEIIDIQTELNILSQMKANADLPQYEGAKIKTIIAADLKSLEPEMQTLIFNEVDDYVKAREVGEPLEDEDQGENT